MKSPINISDKEFNIIRDDLEFNYQKDLTDKLDNHTGNLDQNIINEIVLWKVNRYAKIDKDTLALINTIDRESSALDIEKTRKVLDSLLKTKGIKLPMASTILRFRNNKVYQIIDQRVYRVLYKDQKLKQQSYLSKDELKQQVDLYLQYLNDLRITCDKLGIPFEKSDRILYMADKRINKEIPIENY